MALTESPAAPQAWGRWQQHHPAANEYSMMDNSNFVPYDSRTQTSAPMNGAIMAPQYMVGNHYGVASMPTMGHPCQTQNHFAYAQYDSSPTNMNMPFRLPAQQDRQMMPVTAQEHEVPRASSFPQESPSMQNDRHQSPSSRSETKTASSTKTPHPLNTKDIKYNKPTSAEAVNFTTAIDTLMKAIQKRHDSEDIVKGVPEIEKVVKPEPRSPKAQPQPHVQPEPCPEPAEAPKSKKYICDVDGCGKSFYQSTHLDTHKRAHTGEKPYACNWPRCGRTFSQPGNLKTHMRRHTGEKPFRCEQCSKVFAQRGNLQTHLATHTNAKPFVCKLDKCNKMFTQRGNLKNHQNKYHEKTLLELTDWIVSLSDIDGLSDEDREMYWYFANLYKNSNKGIKGRGKDRRVSNANRVSKSRTAPSSYPVKRVPGPTSLAAYSSKRLPPPEQYMHYHQHDVYDTDMDQSSSASSPRYDGIPTAYRENAASPRYDGLPGAFRDRGYAQSIY
ncbi:C2H2 transcription factor [Colletotrichum karsti]|uniref:C2H2 transcription factor n=1 Tax=Colletotrichum karsti TaxID=1095194 RepID=A0A9P6LPI5_9PEZI|nr:C2H2 transcription factor [Colletotrichum karsti]KAF9881173.1 C2H2 transcription factor [Colletotrichum karsti]